MKPFDYSRARSARDAVAAVSSQPTTKYLGGGTNLVDLMKDGVEQPDRLLDVTRLPLDAITPLPGGGLRIGAMASNTEAANHPRVRADFPVLAQALLSGATAQLRNKATVGGNLLQRTRCYYFTDSEVPQCNKRAPGSGCAALEGFNRVHAILGASENCIATHPSDMAVAMAALGATVQVLGPQGARAIPLAEFHRLPGDTPHLDANLRHGELITSVDLPALPWAKNSLYIKVRDRASYAFALVSVACVLDVQGGTIRNARLALGGVAHKPWRAEEAERSLIGQDATAENFARAGELAVAGAVGREHNAFKIEMARRTVARALESVSRQFVA